MNKQVDLIASTDIRHGLLIYEVGDRLSVSVTDAEYYVSHKQATYATPSEAVEATAEPPPVEATKHMLPEMPATSATYMTRAMEVERRPVGRPRRPVPGV